MARTEVLVESARAAESRAACIAEIVAALISASDARARLNVTKLQTAAAARHGMGQMPKLMDIIAAVPEDYRERLVPYLRAKPVRTASGIAVIAVMCKPHRCPHIALTGNVCVYWYVRAICLSGSSSARGWQRVIVVLGAVPSFHFVQM